MSLKSAKNLAKHEEMWYTFGVMMDLKAFLDKKICVAVSGGMDSVTLLHYLKTREAEYGYTLSACHCEHGIRGEESVEDMHFVEKLCREWGVPLTLFSADCPAIAKEEKESLETVARNFRYRAFAQLVEEKKADYIATAHHQNDDAETVLFHLLRGASLTGVGGMYALNGYLLRPFLDWTREEIAGYAKENQLVWREDKTNSDRTYTRNFLRHTIFPLLEEGVPGATQNLVRFSKLAQEDDELLYDFAKGLVKEEEGEIHVYFCDKKPLFTRGCVLAFKALGLTKDYTALHLEQAFALQKLERGAKLTLPQGLEGEKRGGYLAFYRKKTKIDVEKSETKSFTKEGYEGGRYAVSISETPPMDEDNEWKILQIDGEKLPSTACFRFRKEGDYIHAFGGGKKTLKKFLNEKKIPLSQREYLPLIAEKEGGEVYVICGVELSSKLKVTKETKEIVYVQIKRQLT